MIRGIMGRKMIFDGVMGMREGNVKEIRIRWIVGWGEKDLEINDVMDDGVVRGVGWLELRRG